MQETRFDLTYPDEPGRVIRGKVVSPGEQTAKGPWILMVHGFKGFMDWAFLPLLARGLAESGITTVRFNTSGSGVGEDLEYYSDPAAFERDTYSRQLEDMARVRQAVEDGQFGPLNPEEGLVFGHSRGGGMGIVHAAEHDYRGVITWAAISKAQFFTDKVVQEWRDQGFLEIPNTRTGHTMRLGLDAIHDVERNPDRLDILAAAARLEAPTLVLHGTEDETVPTQSAEDLVQALPNGRKHLIVGANHTFGASHPLKQVDEPLGMALALTMQHACQCLDLPY
ncbi:MAG TPA: prolyl oligopeptidase family serine peptidase [Planctomycetota bacterium]|nr:prolyl oligopeptidase family serine peptidase [Planctomycetota bacterium]HPF15153.1 prolyl oligopeptidase family serine peptidase [Planctomycetota bacterium]HRV81048.1 prolyl oligopeptidase family serine peptidase [Planctomycetota bacterium]